MPGLISEPLASGVVTTIAQFLMFVYSIPSLRAINRKHEGEKCHAYVLVFSSSGGMQKAATVTYQCLAYLLSDKWNSSYSFIMGWLCCSLGFSVLRSSLMCLHGSCSSSGSPGVPAVVDLVVAEGHLATSSD